MKVDREYLGWQILDILEANMPAKLDEIEADKNAFDIAKFGAAITLDDVDTEGYFYGDRSSYPEDKKVVIFVGPSETRPTDNGNWREDAISFDITIVLREDYDSSYYAERDINIKIDRYYRAVSEILFANKGLGDKDRNSIETRSPVHDTEKKGSSVFQSAAVGLDVWYTFTG